jgi:hypothetical protein
MVRNRIERYQRYLSSSINRANEKVELARAYPDECHRLGEALHIGCYTLEWLIEDRDFRNDLEFVFSLKGQTVQEFQEIINDFTDFERFLIVEKEILIRSGLRGDTAQWLIEWCRNLRSIVNNNEISIDEVLSKINLLRAQVCTTAEEQMSLVKQATLHKRIMMGMGGALLVGLNVGVVAATFGLTAPAAALSGALGAAIITTATEVSW